MRKGSCGLLRVLQAGWHLDQQDLRQLVGRCLPCLLITRSLAVNPEAAHVSVFELK